MKSPAQELRDSACCTSTAALLSKRLAVNLHRGYWRQAIRDFLMLKRRGDTINDGHAAEVERFILCCPSRDLDRIDRQVAEWVEMLAVRGRPQGVRVRGDPFGQLCAQLEAVARLNRNRPLR